MHAIDWRVVPEWGPGAGFDPLPTEAAGDYPVWSARSHHGSVATRPRNAVTVTIATPPAETASASGPAMPETSAGTDHGNHAPQPRAARILARKIARTAHARPGISHARRPRRRR